MTINISEWSKEDLEEEIGDISMPGWLELESEFGGVLVEAIDQLGQNATVFSVIKNAKRLKIQTHKPWKGIC